MGRALLESLENRQFFSAGPAGHQGPPPGGLGGGQHQPPKGGPSTQPTTSTAVALYTGTLTLADSTAKPFCLTILTEGTDGAVTASIPGRGGNIQLTGTKSGSTYTLSGIKGTDAIAVTATVDSSGKVTGTFSRTYTEDGASKTDTGTIALTKADATTQPPKGNQGGGPRGGPGGDHGAPVELVANYDGTLTLADGTTRKFALGIITENTDGTVTACIPGPGGGVQLTGTKSGSTYTLSGTKDKVSVSITATVDVSGNVTGTFSKTTTATDGTTSTETGTLALALKAKPTKPTDTTTTTTTTKKTSTSTLTKANSSNATTPSYTNLVTYTGTITLGRRTAEVTIQTYTNKDGKTLVTIRSRRLLGQRSLVLEATVTGTGITASKVDGTHSVAVNFAIGTDGSLTGGVTFKNGTKSVSLAVDADKVSTAVTA